jgi:hypothetical protein
MDKWQQVTLMPAAMLHAWCWCLFHQVPSNCSTLFLPFASLPASTAGGTAGAVAVLVLHQVRHAVLAQPVIGVVVLICFVVLAMQAG